VEREELWEWLGLLAAIVVWWPGLFGWFPLWYRVAVYAFCATVLTVVTVRRLRRVKEGLRHSQEIMEYQRGKQPLPPLEGKKGRK
jgi:membrane protein implicated in regulation of membrane protease activity